MQATIDSDPGAWAILLTHARARTLKMRLYTPGAVALDWPRAQVRATLAHLIDPVSDLAHPLAGPFRARRQALAPGSLAALKLAKLAGLLPAAVVSPLGGWETADTVIASEAEILRFEDDDARQLTAVSRARVPLEGAERTEIAVFRPALGGPEHLAILIGEPQPPGPVLVRLHSECFTGDLLASLKCDCGDQLRGAIAAMAAAAGGGVLLYLAQEGRGIGLVNKLRAYQLQDQGFDTIDANERLGFEADERLFRPAATMLAALGFTRIRLMTNNPDKPAALARYGIAVEERVAHAFAENPHNAAYLATKKARSGHDL
jgi:GTP cyclohydrolase II